MKIILSKSEIEIIEKAAKNINITTEGLFEAYQATMDCNFEQDIHDIVNEDYDFLISEYGLDKESQ